MRNYPNFKVEKHRIDGNPAEIGAAGAFRFTNAVSRAPGEIITCIVGTGGGWDHVSCAVHGNVMRVPTWNEMCYIKDLFFKDDEVVMQLHPAKKDYVNNHPCVLHLWRPQTKEEREEILKRWPEDLVHFPEWPGPIPLPPKEMV